MRGTIAAFSNLGHEVLAIIGGDEIARSAATSVAAAPYGKTSRDKIKKLLPDKIRLLLRDSRYYLWDRRIEKHCTSKIEEFQPDVIYERSAFLCYFGNRLAKRLGIPHFLETSGCLIEIYAKSFGVFSVTISNAVEKAKLRRATRVVVEAKSAASYISKKFDLELGCIIPKPLGVQRDQFLPDATLSNFIRDKHGLENHIVVGFVGTFAPYQGAMLLVEAAKLLEESCPKVVILMVGWGNDAPAAKGLVESYGLRNVIFSGKVDRGEVASYLTTFDIGVVPDCEAHMYPIKTLEYGLFGACPVVPDYSAFEGLVIDAQNGCLFKAQSAEDLALQISRLAADPISIQKFGKAWQEFIDQHMTWERCVQPVLEEMTSVVGGGNHYDR